MNRDFDEEQEKKSGVSIPLMLQDLTSIDRSFLGMLFLTVGRLAEATFSLRSIGILLFTL